MKFKNEVELDLNNATVQQKLTDAFNKVDSEKGQKIPLIVIW
ncbi:hypothetical protein JOC36_000530 [Weissella uvarum]|nr:hypothetical protein [Weissella uvarum]MBM7616981.1 hypothetical protein [Weissella uvarum]